MTSSSSNLVASNAVANGASVAQATDFPAFVGVDWGDREHAVALLAPGAARCEMATLAQTAEAIDDWAVALRERYPGQPIAVCLETCRGPLVYALMKYSHLTLFPLNPKQLARYREAFAPGGAKSDPVDAELLARFVREHHGQLRAWRPDDATTRGLRLLAEARRQWVDRRTAAGNQLLRHLKEVYPLALKFAGQHVYTARFLTLLGKFPSQRELQRASPKQLAKYLPGRRRAADESQAEAAADPRVTMIRQSKLLTTDDAVLAAGRAAIKHLAALLAQLNETIADYERQLDELLAQHPDAEWIASFPGAGAALAPRLLAALGSDRDRFASAEELQSLSGVAPVRVQSGKSRVVKMRRACPRFLRQTFHEFARCSRAKSAWASAYCQMLRSKGHGFHSAIRALAYKWLRILFHCWKTRQPYDEQRYLAALRRQNAPLLAYLRPELPQQNL